MKWDQYYERFYDWSESTQINRISSLTDFGASEEVAEVIQSFMNGKAASRLVKKALEHGVEFSAQEVMDMIDLLDDIPEELISSCKTHFSQEQMDILIDYDIDEDVLRAASKKSNVKFPFDEEDDYAEEYCPPEQPSKLGFWAALFGIASLSGGKKKGHPGHCTGDCANCPPHYGYRYGRWYYGHDHVHGCEFGGNKGSGGL